jgi:site-specific DNA-cytosine methylase
MKISNNDLSQLLPFSSNESALAKGDQCAAFRQIGNAVPPLMAKEIVKAIKEKL